MKSLPVFLLSLTIAWQVATGLPRLCANDPGLTDQELGITDTVRRALELGRKDLPAALALIEAGESADNQRRAKWALIYRLCQDDLAFLSQVPTVFPEPAAPPPPGGRVRFDARSAYESICRFWVAKDHDRIFRAVQDLPLSPVGLRWRSTLAPLLAPVDFPQATALLASLPDSQRPVSLLVNVGVAGRGHDLAQLLSWTDKLPADTAASVLLSVAFGLQEDDDLPKLQKLALATEPPTQEQILRIFGSVLGRDDPNHVFTRIDELAAPAEAAEPILLGALRSVPIFQSQEIATRLLASTHLQTRTEVYSRLVPRLLSANPADAVHFVLSSAPDVRASALQTLVYRWFYTDPSSLAAWISALPAGADRDQAQASRMELILQINLDQAIQDSDEARKRSNPPVK